MDRRRSAHLVVVERKSGPIYYGKWRLEDGTQVKRRLGPAWLDRSLSGTWVRRRGRPAAGFLTEKDAIVEVDRMRREHDQTVGRAHRPDRKFGDVAEDWLRHGEMKRGLKRSTLRDYRQVLDAYLLPAFGPLPVHEVTASAIERWHADFRGSRTAEKVLMVLRAILGHGFKRGWVPENAALAIEGNPVRYSGDYDLCRPGHPRTSQLQPRRGSHAEKRQGQSGPYGPRRCPTPGSRRSARTLYSRRRSGLVSPIGGHIDASALRRRYAAACKRAKLRPLPFHSLRHHFGSIAVNRASLVQVQAWMGHSHIQTTARYLHHRSQATDAALLAEAFSTHTLAAGAATVGS